MYDIIKNVIISGRYELADMLKKIDTVWLQGDLTDDQKAELEALARDHADPKNSYMPIQQQLNSVFANLEELSAAVKSVKDVIKVLQGGIPDVTDPEAYPEYVQPTGAHDAYKTGDKVTFDGQRYVCQMDGCVWDPGTYPAGWLIEENAEIVEAN